MKKQEIIRGIVISIIIIFFISISIISKTLVLGDEFINYYNTYKVFDGEQIYKEVNVISTPLLFNIGLIFFNLLGPKLIVFRIFNIFINIIMAIFIYKLFRKLKIEKSYSIIYTLILEIFIVSSVVENGPNYNILGLMLSIIGLNIYINKTKFNNLKHGIIIFLIIMSKQNIGLFYILAYIITEILLKKKNSIKEILKTIGITTIFLGFYVIYLHTSGSLEGFINYTVLGLKDFTNNILISSFEFIVFDIVIIFYIIFAIYKKLCSNENINNIITLLIFGICMLLVGYPIVDRWHMVIASLILLIALLYVAYDAIFKKLNMKEKVLNVFIIILLILMVILGTFQIKEWSKIICKDKSNMFYLIPISKEKNMKIQQMQNYILNNDKVVIVSAEARNV